MRWCCVRERKVHCHALGFDWSRLYRLKYLQVSSRIQFAVVGPAEPCKHFWTQPMHRMWLSLRCCLSLNNEILSCGDSRFLLVSALLLMIMWLPAQECILQPAHAAQGRIRHMVASPTSVVDIAYLQYGWGMHLCAPYVFGRAAWVCCCEGATVQT